MKLILYDRRKYEPCQTKAFIEPELSNFNQDFGNNLINLVSFNFNRILTSTNKVMLKYFAPSNETVWVMTVCFKF